MLLDKHLLRNNMDNRITICTPTYNRAHLLKRPFESLKSQTNKNFTWLIIDDGSSDNTSDLVKTFQEEADFEIEYHYKENGGRHTALNCSYSFIETDFVINLDSDDELVPEAVERILACIQAIPNEQMKNIWQISGRCIDSKTRQPVSKQWPDKVNNIQGIKQQKKMSKCPGEKSNCRRVDILRKYLFPVYDDTKFVTENTVWEKINMDYDTWCTNDIFRVYYQDSNDSLAKGKVHNGTRMRSRYNYSVFCINELFNQVTFNSGVQISIINICRSALCSGISYNQVMRDLNAPYKKVMITIVGYPLGFLYAFVKDKYRVK